MSLLQYVALLALSCSLSAWAHSFSNKDLIQPVPLQDVQLEHNSQYDRAVSLNREYLLGIDSDRLLKTFRLNAGLDAPGEAFAGSWEDPSCEVRGQFMGHWLSGTAMLGRNTGNKAILEKAGDIVKELKKVQNALGGGYLSAFPTEHLDRLRALQAVWAPLYVIHKIMAGLLDHYTFLGNELALQIVIDEAKFFLRYIEDIVAHEGRAHWTQMLETEYGGMEEMLFNLYDATGDKQWAEMAKYFTKPNFYEPLIKNVDTLPGRHANTHLAQVNGFAAGYEKTGDKDRLAAAAHFFDIITSAHTYATGGNNDGEYWQQPHELAPTIAGDGAGRNTEETCTTYNMMKLARYLFRWSGEARYADFYERAILNGMLGSQRMPADYSSSNGLPGYATSGQGSRRLMSTGNPHKPARAQPQLFTKPANSSAAELPLVNALHPHSQALDWRQQAFAMFDSQQQNLPEWSNAPGPGVIIYLLPLGAGNTKDDSWHHWSTPLNSFWCCSGSIAESFGKLMDSIYFQREHNSSAPELFINQLTPSRLHWRAGGLDVKMNASLYSHDNVARATIQLEPFDQPSGNAKGAGMLKIRIPGWAVPEGASVVLNNDEVVAKNADLKPGSYIAIHRSFKSGDIIKIALPMKITTAAIDDHRPEFSNLRAVMIGPLVMAALTEKDKDITADPSKIADLVSELSDAELSNLGSSPEGAKKLTGADKSYVIAPIGNLVEERYTPYLQFNDAAAVSSVEATA